MRTRVGLATVVAGSVVLTTGCVRAGAPHPRTEGEGTGAVSSLTLTEADARVSRVEDLLRRIPGIQVVQRSDGNYDLRIRGPHTIMGSASDAEPLLVIDDLPIPQGSLGNALAGLAPRDIARIDVLKDAAATGPYGSRGANGVIIISTKRGPRADPPP